MSLFLLTKSKNDPIKYLTDINKLEIKARESAECQWNGKFDSGAFLFGKASNTEDERHWIINWMR